MSMKYASIVCAVILIILNSSRWMNENERNELALPTCHDIDMINRLCGAFFYFLHAQLNDMFISSLKFKQQKKSSCST